MAINPFRKGGNDTIPVSEGGTGATDATTARSNLGAGDLTTAAHGTLDHTGITGVGDLTTAAHASIDHSGIPGVPPASNLISTRSGDDVATAGTASITIPAGWIASDGEILEITFWRGPTVAAHTFNGSTANFPPNAHALNVTDGKVVYQLIRTGATSCDYFVDRAANPGSNNTVRAAAITWGSPITVAIDWNTAGTAGNLVIFARRFR